MQWCQKVTDNPGHLHLSPANRTCAASHLSQFRFRLRNISASPTNAPRFGRQEPQIFFSVRHCRPTYNFKKIPGLPWKITQCVPHRSTWPHDTCVFASFALFVCFPVFLFSALFLSSSLSFACSRALSRLTNPTMRIALVCWALTANNWAAPLLAPLAVCTQAHFFGPPLGWRACF